MRKSPTKAIAVASAFLLAVFTACGPFHRGGVSSAQVIFHNQSTDQADVYAAAVGADPIRIGTVFGGRTDTLRVPETVIGGGGNIRVLARLLTRSYAPSTGQFVLRDGERADVSLPPDGNTLVLLPAR
jgi:hypothetical protein